jgi:hypothetical protein
VKYEPEEQEAMSRRAGRLSPGPRPALEQFQVIREMHNRRHHQVHGGEVAPRRGSRGLRPLCVGVQNLCIEVPFDMDGLRALIERRTRTFSSALLG